MAKKKKSHKLHKKNQFKDASPTNSATTGEAQVKPTPVVAATKGVNSASLNYEIANLHLIKRDIRKVALLAGFFVALQLVLWFLFEHTGLGNAVYHLIKV